MKENPERLSSIDTASGQIFGPLSNITWDSSKRKLCG
jgi:hypothetical protein